jgi:hypothetical protein
LTPSSQSASIVSTVSFLPLTGPLVELFHALRLYNGLLSLVHSGTILSLLDLSQPRRAWVHYMSTESVVLPDFQWHPSAFMPVNLSIFGYLDHEIEEVHFSTVNASGTQKIFIVQRDRSIKEVIYYPDRKVVKNVQKKVWEHDERGKGSFLII